MKPKRLLAVLLCLALMTALAGCLAGCSGGSASSGPADLTGEWKQVNSNSSESWQAATIERETITIYWVSNNGDTRSLYWAGSFEAPEKAGGYSWVSVNDHEKTDKSFLSSSDDTKTITYENGQLSYEASAFGTTTTVRLEKQK